MGACTTASALAGFLGNGLPAYASWKATEATSTLSVNFASSGFFNWLVWSCTTRATPPSRATKARADFL